MFAGIPVAQLNMATGNAAHLFDEVCQTSENSEFPPLTSAKHLIRARATEKSRHTKLITKINNHIDNRGSKTELAVHRTSLADQLEECIAAHEKYINAADFNEDENVADEWIRKAEAVTRSAYERIDLYLRTPRTSSVRSSVVDDISLPQSLNPDNRDQRQSSVGTSVSQSQRQPNASILATVNEVHERLRQEIDLRRSAEVQLARILSSVGEKTATDAENFQREIQRNNELQRQLQQQTEQMARDKKRSEEAEIQYRALLEKEKREAQIEHDKAMQTIESRLKQLEQLTQSQASTTNAVNSGGAIRKRQVAFTNHDTEVTSEQHADSEIRLDSDRQSLKTNHLSEKRDQLAKNLAGFNREHISTLNRKDRDTDTENDAIKRGHTRTGSSWYWKTTGEPENPYSECRN